MERTLKDLRTSYDKENQASFDRIGLLSTVATHFSNKELKSAFPCSDPLKHLTYNDTNSC